MKTLSLPNHHLARQKSKSDRASRYELKWRQKQLLVRLCDTPLSASLPSVESQRWLVACLKRSPVRLVTVAPELSEDQLKFWADACEQAKKDIYLQIPNTSELPKKHASLRWYVKRVFDQ